MTAAFQNRASPILDSFGFCDQVTSSSRNWLQGPLPAHAPTPLHAMKIFTPSVSVHTVAVSINSR